MDEGVDGNGGRVRLYSVRQTGQARDRGRRLTFPAGPLGCTCPRQRAIGRPSHPS